MKDSQHHTISGSGSSDRMLHEYHKDINYNIDIRGAYAPLISMITNCVCSYNYMV